MSEKLVFSSQGSSMPSLPFASLGIFSFTATMAYQPEVTAVRIKVVLSDGQCRRYYISLGRHLWEDGAPALPGSTSPSVLFLIEV